MTLLAPSLQAFFTDRLMRQLQASDHTIRSYRATWRLLLLFAAAQTGKAPSELDFADLSAPLVTGFLDHLEHQRGNTVRTRNLRLAAIHSMFACAAPQHPEHADDIARVLAVPGKRFRTTVVTHLSEEEITALLQAPDPGTWTGRRDHALMLAAVTTGLRAGELAGLTRADTHLGDGPHLECHGKGRKDRVTPLLRDTVATPACSISSKASWAWETALAAEQASTHRPHSEQAPHWRQREVSERTWSSVRPNSTSAESVSLEAGLRRDILSRGAEAISGGIC